MADSFNGLTMMVTTSSFSRDASADVSIRHIPGGDITYVDIGGRRARMLTLDLFFALASDYEAMELVVGTAHNLIYIDYPSGILAVLISLVRSSRGLSTNGETHATASFVLLS